MIVVLSCCGLCVACTLLRWLRTCLSLAAIRSHALDHADDLATAINIDGDGDVLVLAPLPQLPEAAAADGSRRQQMTK